MIPPTETAADDLVEVAAKAPEKLFAHREIEVCFKREPGRLPKDMLNSDNLVALKSLTFLEGLDTENNGSTSKSNIV